MKRLFLSIFLLIGVPCFAQNTPALINSQGILAGTDSVDIPPAFYDAILRRISSRSLVGMGEGTHGTAEFNAFRADLTKKLILDKGFDFVCFENNYGGTFALDRAIQAGNTDIEALLRENFIAIYHTPELLGFFSWFAESQKNLAKKVHIVGMDYAELMPALKAMEATMVAPEKYRKQLDSLAGFCAFQDNLYKNKFDRTQWFKNGMEGYAIISRMQADSALEKKDAFQFALASTNLKLGFEIIHHFKTSGKDLSRDSAMAVMVKVIKEFHPEAKVAIWAHNAHMAKGAIFDSTNGGGEGAFLNRFFPGDYFVIGTLTSTGTYSVTNDYFPTRFNKFSVISLSKAPRNAIEVLSASFKRATLLLDPLKAFPLGQKYPMRFSGFRKAAKKQSDFAAIVPASCFDLLLYLDKTQASEHFMK